MQTSFTAPTVSAPTAMNFQVTVTDTKGLRSTDSVAITVNPPPPPIDSTKPLVSLTQPLSGSTVTAKSKLTITASASDNVGVVKVEFYVNGVLAATDTSSPYSYIWSVPGAKNKTYQLQAKAYDAAGNVGVSNFVSVTAK